MTHKDRRRGITQPADWWHAFDAAAAKAKLPLSEWVGRACIKQIPKAAAKQLSQRTRPGRPKNKEAQP